MQDGRIKLDFCNGYCCRFWPTGVTRCPLHDMKKKQRESAMNSDPTGWDCLLDRYLGSDRDTSSQVAGHDAEHLLRISLRDAMPVGSASETTPPQNSPLLHFSGESLWPRLTGTVINSVKAALRYLLYLKVVFIDWNFPELIWPSVKFTIHTTSTPVNEGKYDRTRLL